MLAVVLQYLCVAIRRRGDSKKSRDFLETDRRPNLDHSAQQISTRSSTAEGINVR